MGLQRGVARGYGFTTHIVVDCSVAAGVLRHYCVHDSGALIEVRV